MRLILEIGSGRFEVDTNGTDISIPLKFNGPQPNTYGVPKATGSPFEGGGFIGDTRQGGSCNFETYTLTPHCNGTHTEGIGHISKARIPIHSMLDEELIPAMVLSISPIPGPESKESYSPSLEEKDLVICRKALEEAWNAGNPLFADALIIRTLPNEDSKMSRDYMKQSPAFFTLEAMEWIREKRVKHLLTDLPSVDRLFDDGKLSAHHIFWEVDQGSNDISPETAPHFTITEFIYVPDSLPDGIYLLNLQVASWETDAAPSRPVLFSLNPVGE